MSIRNPDLSGVIRSSESQGLNSRFKKKSNGRKRRELKFARVSLVVFHH